jgi:hypothetical protein
MFLNTRAKFHTHAEQVHLLIYVVLCILIIMSDGKTKVFELNGNTQFPEFNLHLIIRDVRG